MNEPIDRIARGREILESEARAILQAARELGSHFDETVTRIVGLEGKVVITGVGKSGLVGRKIAATLSSTGTPAYFLHAAEAMHGDLGIVEAHDLLIAISNSGETSEVLNVVAAVGAIGTPVVAMTSNAESSLARGCAHWLPIAADHEVCSLGLAPTTSTTVTLALGDALALVLSELRAFTREDFAVFHPGGHLGRRLALKVGDIMLTGADVPIVEEEQPVAELLATMDAIGPRGAALVIDGAGLLSGIVTDGDLRRFLRRSMHTVGTESNGSAASWRIAELMTRDPVTIEHDALASEALNVMENKAITELPIVDSRGAPIGIIQIHDLLGRGTVII